MAGLLPSAQASALESTMAASSLQAIKNKENLKHNLAKREKNEKLICKYDKCENSASLLFCDEHLVNPKYSDIVISHSLREVAVTLIKLF